MLASSLPALAQQAASIRGSVLDAEGGPVAGAHATAVNVETGLERSATTVATGTYALPELPVGTYAVTVEAEGSPASAGSSSARRWPSLLPLG